MKLNKLWIAMFLVGIVSIFGACKDHDHDHQEINKKTLTNKHDDHPDHTSEEDHDEHGEHEEHEGEHEDEHEEEVVKFGPNELKEFGIVFDTVKNSSLEKTLILKGEVGLNQEKIAHISSRFDGLIKKVFVKAGQKVKKGQLLALMENSNNLSVFRIVATHTGTILNKSAASGESVQAGDDLFMIANLHTVWVNLEVYQQDLSSIKLGQSVWVKDPFAKSGEIVKKGVVDYVEPIMNQNTRTVRVRVLLENSNLRWKPGMFVEGEVELEKSGEKLILPKSAVHFYENKKVVFVKTKEGVEPKVVILGNSNKHHVEILSGLSLGEVFVRENGFVIKSELQKSEMGHGHAH